MTAEVDPEQILWKLSEARLMDALRRVAAGATPEAVLEFLDEGAETTPVAPNRGGTLGSAAAILNDPLPDDRELIFSSVIIVAAGLDPETGKEKLTWDVDTDTPRYAHLGMLQAMTDVIGSALFDELTEDGHEC